MKLTRARTWFRYSAKRRAVGQITDDVFRGEVEKLVAVDDQGRTWRIHAEPPTGVWVVEDGGERREAVPPGFASSAVLTDEELYGEGGLGTLLVSALVVYVLMAVILYLFVAEVRDQPGILGGLGLAIAIGVLIALVKRRGGWAGRVKELREEEVWIPPKLGEEIPGHSETRVFALVEDDRGRSRRIPAMPGWQVGDRLVKRRGSSMITREP